MTAPGTGSSRRPLVDAWSASTQAVIDLAGTHDDADLAVATDLSGWTVGDVLAHLAALDSDLAGNDPVLAELDAIPAGARDARSGPTPSGGSRLGGDARATSCSRS